MKRQVKFATTDDSREAQMRADVVVDLEYGAVVKNRFGSKTGARSLPAALSWRPS